MSVFRLLRYGVDIPTLRLSKTASSAPATPADSLFCRRCAAFVLAGTLCLCWPMLLQGGALVFYDTGGYLWHGWRLLDVAAELLGVPGGLPDPAGGVDVADPSMALSSAPVGAPVSAPGLPIGEAPALRGAMAKAASTRSLFYSLFVYVSSRPFGLAGTAMLQTAFVLLVAWAVLRDALVPFGRRAIVGCAAVALLTPLPFMASFAMPDLLGAVPILFAMLLARGWDTLDGRSRLVVTLITCVALLAHLGNIPLALACLSSAIAIRLLDGRRDPVSILLALGPLLLVIGFNATLSRMAFGEVQVTPYRVPVMLARSMEDGPARRYLQEHCDSEGYAVCELFEEFPDDVGQILWKADGAYIQAPLEVQARVRAEEMTIVLRTVAAYPLWQIAALMRNSLLQFSRVGTADIALHDVELRVVPKNGLQFDRRRGREFLKAAGLVHRLTWFAGLAAISVLVARSRSLDRTPLPNGAPALLVVLVIGLLANAAIYGGLSAPVDRYQSRVAWLAPAVAFWLCALLAARTPADSTRR